MKSIHNLLVLMLLSLALCVISCSESPVQGTLNRAEAIMETHPDSAMSLLSTINKNELSGKRQKAQYALLMSMALDKNYIDTTTFDVLQPAIDYYLDKGTPDEKLRTYYYQGRIFQNQGDRDNALNSFINGIDVSPNCSDSLCVARTLVAQGGLYNDFYDFESYTNCHIKAAKIYKNLSLSWYEFDCLLNALNGAIALGNENKGDSLLALCYDFKYLDNTQKLLLSKHELSHALKFENLQKLKMMIECIGDNFNNDTNVLLNLALAYNKIGNDNTARTLLDYVKKEQVYDTLKYLAITVPILENTGNYKDALGVYREFSHIMDSINTLRFDQKARSVEDKHRIELKAQQDARDKAKIIWGCIGGIVFLVMVVVILFLLFRSNKSQKNLAIEQAKTSELENIQLKSANEMALQKAKITELENGRLKSEREKLALENKNLQLEKDKKTLEAENLAHRVEALENESDSLKSLIASKEELPIEVQKEIKVRIEMLNSLLASYITDNDQYEKPYDVWIKELTANKDEFMNSNRLAFQVSHPHFIQYFENHNLTTDEINYVCLYAIGLRGKEVGNYMNKRSHVNTSSAIRKKLGIDKHETNIGIYVRKLLKKL